MDDGMSMMIITCSVVVVLAATSLMLATSQQQKAALSNLSFDGEEDYQKRGRHLHDRLEEEEEDMPLLTVKPRQNPATSPWRQIYLYGDSRAFLRTVRFKRSCFLRLASQLREALEQPINFFTRSTEEQLKEKKARVGKRALCYIDILALTLKRLGSGCDIDTLAIIFGVSHATADAYSFHGMRCIAAALSYEGGWFRDDDEKQGSMQRFQLISPSLSGVVAASDCKEWTIDVPGKFVQAVSTQGSSGLYYNGKYSHSYSEKSLSMVDSRGIIRHNEYPKPGSYSDKRLFNESVFVSNPDRAIYVVVWTS